MIDTEQSFAGLCRKNWWVYLLQGLAAIAFGILAWTLPGISLATLVILFGVFVLFQGFLGLWGGIAGRKTHENWWLPVIGGLLGIGIGILTFVVPGITAVALVFYIAIWAVATGVLQIVAAIHLRREIKGEWLLVLGGILSIIFGILVMTNPGAGAVAIVWLIGIYAIVFGISLSALAFRVRRFGKIAQEI